MAFFLPLLFSVYLSPAQDISLKQRLHYAEQNYQTNLNIDLTAHRITVFDDTVYSYRFQSLSRSRVSPIPLSIQNFLVNEKQLGVRFTHTCFGAIKDFYKVDVKSYTKLDSVKPKHGYFFSSLTVQDMVSPFPDSEIRALIINFYNRDKELSVTSEYAHGIGFLRIINHEKNKDFLLTHIDNIPLAKYVKEKESEIKNHLLSLKSPIH